MDKLLEQIFQTKKHTTSGGELIDIHSETSREQCLFLQDIIRRNKFTRSVEIGFAYGISTLAIVEEIKKNGGSHCVIDKFQNTNWKGVGLDLVEQAGYLGDTDFREDYCYMALPALLSQEKKFDFAYIDSTKQFDWIMVNFFYLDKLMDTNGVIIFDDAAFAGIRKLLRYIVQFPNYKVYDQFPKNADSSHLRKFADLLKILPGSKRVLRNDMLMSDTSLEINSGCVALIKTGDDNRSWDWHVSF